MANRLMLGTDTFRISKPGYNVLTETADQNLIFDSARRAGGALMAGSFTIVGRGAYTVGFGQTLPSPPFVTFIYTKNGAWHFANAGHYVSSIGFVFYGAGVIVSSTGAQFWKSFDGTDTFRYTIWTLDM